MNSQLSGAKRFFSGPVLLFAWLWVLLVPFSTVFAADLKMVGEGIFEEEKSGRMWQLERSRKFKTTADVEKYLQDLNTGEYDDWRLPSKQELFELFVFFDFKKNGDVAVPDEGNYWYTGTYGEMEVGAWEEGDG